MLSRQIYEVPRIEIDGLERVEEFYLDLLQKYRNGELDQEGVDLLDYANTVLMSIK